MSKPLDKKQLKEARSVERQQGIAHLYASGPRVVMEAMLEISSGKPRTRCCADTAKSRFRHTECWVPMCFRFIKNLKPRFAH